MFRHVIREQLKVPAKIDYLGELRDFVTKVGRRHGFSERIINAFKLSIDEAATNIIKHAYRDYDGDITIRAIVKKNSLTIVLIDQGKYFDPRQVGDPDLKRYVEIGKKGGLGIFIMRRLLDEIDYRKTEEGNELWMVKYRDAAQKKKKLTVSTIPLGLKARYWLVSVSIFTLFLALAYLYFFFRQEKIILDEFLDRGRRAASVLASDVANNLSQLPGEILQQLIDTGSSETAVLLAAENPIQIILSSEYRDIMYDALVVDPSGGILASASLFSGDESGHMLLETFQVPPEAELIRPGIYLLTTPSNDRVLNLLYPVSDPQKNHLCDVHFQMRWDQIHQEIVKARFNYLNLAILIWIIGSAGFFLLIYIVMNPFRRLQQWVKVMGQPGVVEEMDIDSSTEVGEIAKAFSDITIKLRESQANLAEQERLQKEMQVAQEIQQTLLPSEFPKIEGYELSSYYAAAKEVGGDYYDFVEVDKDTLGVVVGDVSGKGVPGSLIMTMIRTALRTEARGIKDAAEVLSRVNDFIVNDMKKGMFVTLFYVIIDSKRRRINYASAGHNPMILYRASRNKTYYLNPRGFPIGISLPDKELFRKSIESDTLALKEDDILLVYTDGITEAMNGKRHLYGEERFLQTIRKHGELPVTEFIDRLHEELLSFTEGSPQNDDITLVAIKEKTSAEKVEYTRAKKAFELIQSGEPIKEACEEARISTYAYYNKYKEQFEKEGVESFTLSEEDQIEAKHLSIEEKTKIYDVVLRFPEYGPKRIAEELNTERYSFAVISVAKIYEELVHARLNTKELREAFIARGGKKRRIKPPGTPMLTLDGQVIIKRPGFERSEESIESKSPAEDSPTPRRSAPTRKIIDGTGDEQEIRPKLPLSSAPPQDFTEEKKLDVLSLGANDIFTMPLEDLFDKRNVVAPVKSLEKSDEEAIPEFEDAFEFAETETEQVDEQSILHEESDDLFADQELEYAEDTAKDFKAGLQQGDDEESPEADPDLDLFDEFDYAAEQTNTTDLVLHQPPLPETSQLEKEYNETIDKLAGQENSLFDLLESAAAIREDGLSDDFEELSDLDIARQHLDKKVEDEEREFVELVQNGGGLTEPQPQEDDTLDGQPIEDVEILSESESTILDEPQLNEPFDEFLEMEEENGLITAEGELDSEILAKLRERYETEQDKPARGETDHANAPWEIKEVSKPEQSPVSRGHLSYEDLAAMMDDGKSIFEEEDDEFNDILRAALVKVDKRNNQQRKFNLPSKAPVAQSPINENSLNRAIQHYEEKNYDQAIALFEQLLQKNPNNVTVHHFLGNAYFRKKRYSKASQQYEKVLTIDPQNADAFENLGVIYANQGDFSHAIRHWENLLRIAPHRKDIRDSIRRAKKHLEQL